MKHRSEPQCQREPLVLVWSGGKDSARALYELWQEPSYALKYEVIALLTTVTEGFERISMHGVPCSLLMAQSVSIGLPIVQARIPQKATNSDYESSLRQVLDDFQKLGVSTSAFGDIFLEDLRRYREQMLAGIGWKGLFPIWKRDTARLSHEFIQLGFKAVLVCVDSQLLDRSFAGRDYDEKLLNDLPAGVDPCGENGEFHTFVFDGPIFKQPVRFTTGETVLRERWFYCDLLQEKT